MQYVRAHQLMVGRRQDAAMQAELQSRRPGPSALVINRIDARRVLEEGYSIPLSFVNKRNRIVSISLGDYSVSCPRGLLMRPPHRRAGASISVPRARRGRGAVP